jgi:hypothetical protein
LAAGARPYACLSHGWLADIPKLERGKPPRYAAAGDIIMRAVSSLAWLTSAIAINIVSIVNVGSAYAASSFSTASLEGSYTFRTGGESLFTAPAEVTSSPVYLAAVGVFVFDGAGRLKGTVAVSATRSRSAPSGKYGAMYSSQIECDAKMVGTYTVDADGTGTMTINFTPTRESQACGTSTGLFDIVLVSPRLIEVASTGQTTADPSKGEFNAYVVQGEIIKQSAH